MEKAIDTEKQLVHELVCEMEKVQAFLAASDADADGEIANMDRDNQHTTEQRVLPPPGSSAKLNNQKYTTKLNPGYQEGSRFATVISPGMNSVLNYSPTLGLSHFGNNDGDNQYDYNDYNDFEEVNNKFMVDFAKNPSFVYDTKYNQTRAVFIAKHISHMVASGIITDAESVNKAIDSIQSATYWNTPKSVTKQVIPSIEITPAPNRCSSSNSQSSSETLGVDNRRDGNVNNSSMDTNTYDTSSTTINTLLHPGGNPSMESSLSAQATVNPLDTSITPDSDLSPTISPSNCVNLQPTPPTHKVQTQQHTTKQTLYTLDQVSKPSSGFRPYGLLVDDELQRAISAGLALAAGDGGEFCESSVDDEMVAGVYDDPYPATCDGQTLAFDTGDQFDSSFSFQNKGNKEEESSKKRKRTKTMKDVDQSDKEIINLDDGNEKDDVGTSKNINDDPDYTEKTNLDQSKGGRKGNKRAKMDNTQTKSIEPPASGTSNDTGVVKRKKRRPIIYMPCSIERSRNYVKSLDRILNRTANLRTYIKGVKFVDNNTVIIHGKNYRIVDEIKWKPNYIMFTMPNNFTSAKQLIKFRNANIPKELKDEDAAWIYYENSDQTQFLLANHKLPFRYTNQIANFYEPFIIRERLKSGEILTDEQKAKRYQQRMRGKSREDSKFLIQALCPYCQIHFTDNYTMN